MMRSVHLQAHKLELLEPLEPSWEHQALRILGALRDGLAAVAGAAVDGALIAFTLATAGVALTVIVKAGQDPLRGTSNASTLLPSAATRRRALLLTSRSRRRRWFSRVLALLHRLLQIAHEGPLGANCALDNALHGRESGERHRASRAAAAGDGTEDD